jgi:chromate reductase
MGACMGPGGITKKKDHHMFKVAVIVGSLRKESTNLKLAKAFIALGKGKFEANILNIADLPLFNEDLEKDFPAQATRMKNEIAAADAVLFVTPEYNRSMPAPLKNAIDWASRPYGKNSFAGKPGAIAGTSPGTIGTAVAQHNLKGTLSYLDVHMMGQPEMYVQFKPDMIDASGNVASEDTKKFFQKFVDAFAQFVEGHKTCTTAKAA